MFQPSMEVRTFNIWMKILFQTVYSYSISINCYKDGGFEFMAA